MLTTVEGIYKNGKVELAETPPDIPPGRVLVTFLPENSSEAVPQPPTRGQRMSFGMFPQLRQLTDADFQAAEFHGDTDDGLDGL